LPLHIQIHTDFLSPHFKTSLLQRLRVWCARLILPKASRVRVVSRRIADSISASGITLQNPPVVLPIRIEIEEIDAIPKIDFYTQFPQFKFTILMASRLTKEKRIMDALKIFKIVHEAYPFAGLLIAGEGPERARLEKYAHTLGIADSVVFLGFRNDVASLLKSANVFLSTSEFEGYGMSVVEAGLSRCPVVTTDVGISGEILKDGINAFVCPVGDVACFYTKIMKLMSDNATREVLVGRLSSDVRATVPNKEEYINQYVKGLEESRENI